MQRIGLVLSGGGGKGAYQIGVWKALRKYGLDKYITGVSGTSIGALNLTLFVQNDYEKAESAWKSISNEKILTSTHKTFIDAIKNITADRNLLNIIFDLTKNGVFTRDGLLEMIEEYLDLGKISNSKLDSYACCCELPFFNVKYFKLNGLPEEQILKILLASSAIPLVFKPEIINNRIYTDGGIKDIAPVKPLYDEGYRRFIVAGLDPGKTVDKSRFPEAKFIEISPMNNEDYSFDDVFDFSAEGAAKRIQQGYADADNLLCKRIKSRVNKH